MITRRSETLTICAGFTALVSVLILYGGIWSLAAGVRAGELITSALPVPLWVSGLILMLGSYLSYQWRDTASRLAGWILVVTTESTVVLFCLWLSNPYGVLALLLPNVYAIFLFDRKQAIVILALNSGVSVILNAALFRGRLPASSIVLPALLVLVVSVFVAILIFTLFSELDWYEKNYVSAHQQKLIIRDNEAKLERLVKDLNLYNELLVKAQNEAEQAKNAKQVFAQTVSHELRTPLNLIIGFSETMFNTPESYAAVNWTPELRSDVECIYQNSQHLKSLINDVLDLASLENRSYEVNPVDVDINTIILESVFISRGRFDNKGLYLNTDLIDYPLMVYADPVRIRQVVINLLSNALKYTTRGGVTLTTRRSSFHAVVYVNDTGKGIPEDSLEKVFEAFYQVDKSMSREDSGTGLGLTISKQLVEVHGGDIHITSRMGQGTTVQFSLPLINETGSTGPSN